MRGLNERKCIGKPGSQWAAILQSYYLVRFPPGFGPECRAGNTWHARRESNPQPSDLESGALPIELQAYAIGTTYYNRPNWSKSSVSSPEDGTNAAPARVCIVSFRCQIGSHARRSHLLRICNPALKKVKTLVSRFPCFLTF